MNEAVKENTAETEAKYRSGLHILVILSSYVLKSKNYSFGARKYIYMHWVSWCN